MPLCTTPVLREQLGDYGYFENSDGFHCEGNIFDHFNSRSSNVDISPKQHRIDEQRGYNTDSDTVRVRRQGLGEVILHNPTGLSLPSNNHVNSILMLLSARLTNRYLVTRVIQCDEFTECRGPSDLLSEPMCTEVFHIVYLIVELDRKKFESNAKVPLCTFAKPLVWYRD